MTDEVWITYKTAAAQLGADRGRPTSGQYVRHLVKTNGWPTRPAGIARALLVRQADVDRFLEARRLRQAARALVRPRPDATEVLSSLVGDAEREAGA